MTSFNWRDAPKPPASTASSWRTPCVRRQLLDSQQVRPRDLAAGILSRTERLAVIATLSTTFSHPFHIARHLASLAHIGKGRIGANLVTSFSGEANFGLHALPSPEERYERAGEFIEVLDQLWTSWRGPEGPSPIDFTGEHFSVKGPLSIRPFDGDLLIGQSGASPPGIAVAARSAQFVFTSAQADHVLERYLSEMSEASARLRSDGTRPTILSGLAPVLGDTSEEAAQNERELVGAFSFAEQRSKLEEVLGDMDLSDLTPDDPFPRERLKPLSEIGRRQGRAAIVYDLIAHNEDLVLSEVVRSQNTSNGHRTVVGTAEEVANEIKRIILSGLTNGFIILLPKRLDLAARVFDELFPRLQDIGVLRAADGPVETRRRFLRRPIADGIQAAVGEE